MQRRGSSLKVSPRHRRHPAQHDDAGALVNASRRKAKPGASRAGETSTDFRVGVLALPYLFERWAGVDPVRGALGRGEGGRAWCPRLCISLGTTGARRWCAGTRRSHADLGEVRMGGETPQTTALRLTTAVDSPARADARFAEARCSRSRASRRAASDGPPPSILR